MKKMIFAALALIVVSFYAWADSSAFKDNPPDEYVVQKGDTLWDISGRFLDSPWLWPEIWHVNPDIANPHLIFPGDVIRMVYIDGEPRLTVDRTVKMSPGTDKLEPHVRASPISAAIKAIPMDKIASYLKHSLIVMPKDFEGAPYMLAGTEKRIIVGKGDIAYARGDFSQDIENYGVYRKGETFTDPESGELLGVEAQAIGDVHIEKVTDDVAKVMVTTSYQELRPGDVLLPRQERSVDSIFYPSAPEAPIEGKILAVEGGVTQIGTMDVVIINKGERDGLQAGNVLAAYVQGEVVDDRTAHEKVALPDERGGLVMVYRTFEKLSYALVMKATQPLNIGDKLRNP